jgi:nucleotide-binding universal stress UspA family protein
MPGFKHILFPIDFSDQSRAIAPYVIEMANRYQARVTMLHALDLHPGYPGWPAHAIVTNFGPMIEGAQHYVTSFLKSEFEGISVTRLVEEGSPGGAIIDYAAKEQVDLIMLPTHGYGPFRRFLLGSVTAKILHDAKCPVWTSAHTENAPAVPTGYRNLLCAVDLTDQSGPLIQWAAGFAGEHGATLKLVHAVAGTAAGVDASLEGGQFRKFLFDAARAELACRQRETGTSFETVLEGGDVAHVVRQAAEASRADLVVIGRGVISEPLGRLRGKAYSIIREAPCPVISV